VLPGLCENFHKRNYTERHKGAATFPAGRRALFEPRRYADGMVPDGQPDVRLVRVVKRFGEVAAVDGISLNIERGQFFSLLGPSGCGKTTTLRMIGGFEQPDEGRIELAGTDVAGLPPHRRDVNTVFQSYALFPHLNVFDNVAYGLRRKRVPKDEIGGRVSRMLGLVELPGMEARRPTQLSGGQQQRVALARALVNEPQVLLLDEPLGALDLKLRKQMQLFLKSLQHEIGITFIYVTHDQEEAMTMSDRIAVMREGRIEQVGPPQDVYERPATEFVAAFLGASNLLEGTIGPAEGDHRTIELASGEKVRVPAAALDGSEGSIRLGVRPEKFMIGAQDGMNAIEGTVKDATFVGVSNVYTVETKDGHTVTVYAQNLGTSGDRPPGPGQTVTLSWHPEHTFVVSEGRRSDA
jgi:spermidine/putrescine transport system ATP-binding protein